MKNIIPVTDLQRQAAQILNELDESVVITQRERAAGDLELVRLLEAAKQEVENKQTISHVEVKKRLNFKN